MKGIVLAGGGGTRLYPASIPISKILLPVYDKPMVYYPISTLLMAGIQDILIITNPADHDNFKKLLGTGENLGVKFNYAIQHVPRGIADSFLIAEDFIQNEPVALILGDNIFYGKDFSILLKNAVSKNRGATVFGYKVPDPERFGVAEFDKLTGKALSIEEKPKNPKSDFAVVGLYFYDNQVVDLAKKLTPSARGELEITDLNKIYLFQNKLDVQILDENFSWFDAGTHESLLDASVLIQTSESLTGVKIACLEETAYNMGYVSAETLRQNLSKMPSNPYYDYILRKL